MRLDDALGDGEAKSHAAGRADAVGIDLDKGVENAVEVFRGYSDAGIGYETEEVGAADFR